MGSCGLSCIKYLVFFFNFLFAVNLNLILHLIEYIIFQSYFFGLIVLQLSGLVLVGVGAVILSRYYHYYSFVGDTFWIAPLALIIVGGVVFLIAFIGCYGAVKESSCMTLFVSLKLSIGYLI